jgi:hypothetical protein
VWKRHEQNSQAHFAHTFTTLTQTLPTLRRIRVLAGSNSHGTITNILYKNQVVATQLF